MIIKNDLLLTNYNSYRVQSKAAIALFPETLDDFKKILEEYSADSLSIVGKGCNTIFAKEYYDHNQPIVFIRENFSRIELRGDTIYTQSGTDLKDLSIYAMENSLSGLEYFYDIPGCVGGGLTMNAGSCGISLSDYVKEIEYIDFESKEVRTIEKKDLGLGYRDSIFKSGQRCFILSCSFLLPRGDRNEIMQRMKSIEEKRIAKQPREYPNAGSVFVRPAENVYVGPMIENLGLKGYRIGGAEVSLKHAGFIVNVDNATGEDIVNLISHIQTSVKGEYGVDLQTEQRILI